MNLNLVQYLRSKPVIALVGATNDRTKYGNIILRDLSSRGFEVRPVNPRAESVEELPSYPDLKTANHDGKIGLLVYVIPPPLTLGSLKEALELGLRKVWVQPGAADDAVRDFLEKNNFEYLSDACVMIEA